MTRIPSLPALAGLAVRGIELAEARLVKVAAAPKTLPLLLAYTLVALSLIAFGALPGPLTVVRALELVLILPPMLVLVYHSPMILIGFAVVLPVLNVVYLFNHRFSMARWTPFLAVGLLAAFRYCPGVLKWSAPRVRRVYLGIVTRGLRIQALVAVFFALAFLSAIWSLSPVTTIARTGSFLLLAVVVFWFLWGHFDRIERIESMLTLLLVVGVALGIAGFFADLERGPSVIVTEGLNRYAGMMVNPNWVGAFCVLLLPLAYWYARSRNAWLGIGAALVLLASIALSGQRSALVAVGLLAFYQLVRKRSLLFWGIAAVAGVGGWAAIALGFADTSSFVAYLRLEKGFSGRTEAWVDSWGFFLQRPLVGYGFGVEDRIIDHFGKHYQLHAGAYFHNSFIGMALQLGAVGFVLFYGPLFYLLVCRRTRQLARVSTLANALRMVAIAGLVIAVWESWLYSTGNGHTLPFWACVGALARLHTLSQTAASPEPVVTSADASLDGPREVAGP